MFRCHERVEPCRGRDCTVGRHSADNLKAPHAAKQPLGNVSSLGRYRYFAVVATDASRIGDIRSAPLF